MVSVNLETNPIFKEKLAQQGFRKKGVNFVREYNESIQTFGFGYATYGQIKTRFYNCIYGISYPKASAYGETIGEYIWGVQEQIGYRIPQRKFFWSKPVYAYKTWRIAATDSEEKLLKTISDIVSSIERYIIPHMNKYSTMRSFVEALEAGQMNMDYDRKLPPVLYRLLGEEDKAQAYIRDVIAYYSSPEYNRLCGTTHYQESKDYKEMSCHSSNKNLPLYQEFAKKFNHDLV